jgi:aubergine
MIAIKPKITKTFNTINLRSNHFGLKVNKSILGLRFNIDVLEFNNSCSQEEITTLITENDEILKSIFSWYSVSGNTLYAFAKQLDSLKLVDGPTARVSLLDSEGKEGYTVTILNKKEGKIDFTINLV